MTFCTEPWLSSITSVSAPLEPLATASANCTASAWLALSALPARMVIGGGPSAARAGRPAGISTAKHNTNNRITLPLPDRLFREACPTSRSSRRAYTGAGVAARQVRELRGAVRPRCATLSRRRRHRRAGDDTVAPATTPSRRRLRGGHDDAALHP